jgi:hypothetical protein
MSLDASGSQEKALPQRRRVRKGKNQGFLCVLCASAARKVFVFRFLEVPKSSAQYLCACWRHFGLQAASVLRLA